MPQNDCFTPPAGCFIALLSESRAFFSPPLQKGGAAAFSTALGFLFCVLFTEMPSTTQNSGLYIEKLWPVGSPSWTLSFVHLEPFKKPEVCNRRIYWNDGNYDHGH